MRSGTGSHIHYYVMYGYVHNMFPLNQAPKFIERNNETREKRNVLRLLPGATPEWKKNTPLGRAMCLAPEWCCTENLARLALSVCIKKSGSVWESYFFSCATPEHRK